MNKNSGTTDLGTLIGLLAGIGIIVLGIISAGGKIAWFWNFNSILIVRWYFCSDNGKPAIKSSDQCF